MRSLRARWSVLLMGWLMIGMMGTAAADRPARRGTGGGGRMVVDRVVAIVNDVVILRSELDLRLAPLRSTAMEIADPAERTRRLSKLASQVLDEMISDELVVQAAQAAKLTVEPEELEQTIAYIKKQNGLDTAGLEAAMKAQGLSYATFTNDLLRQRAINTLLGPKLTISDEDIRARYDEMQRRADGVAKVLLSQIKLDLPAKPTDQQLAEARAKAVRAIERVKDGEPFAQVARELTDDQTTRATGGQLGWIEPGTINPDWEPIVFGMDKGELRGPIAGNQALFVFYVDEVQRTQLKPFADMKAQLAGELRQRALAKLTRAWIEELRKRAHIEIKLPSNG